MTDARFNDVYYERFLGEDKLMGCRCKGCGEQYVPPRPICPKCYGSAMDWVQMSGKGKLAAFTCIRVVPPNMQVWGFDRDNPYCSGVVELEEGGRIVALIDEVDPKKPEKIHVGMPLSVKFLHKGDGGARQTILAFTPA
jgi:hypothetical protein